jgi:hypothetical protein
MTKVDERSDMIRKFIKQNSHYGQLLKSKDVPLIPVSVSFLNKYHIYRSVYHLHKPVEFYFGYSPSRSIIELTGQPKQFIKLAQRDKVFLQSPEDAINYLETFFEITHPRVGLVYIIESVNDIRFKPGLSTEEEIKKNNIIHDFSSRIHPIDLKSEEEKYIATYFVVNDQQLEKHESRLSANGRVTTKKTILLNDLPVLYGL